MKSKNEKEKKKILSNLNERDKKLLACVGGVAVLAGGGYLVTNSYTRMAQLAEEHATISTELEGKNAKISQRKSLTKQLQTLNAKTLDQAKKYYGTTNQGEFIFLIDKLVKAVLNSSLSTTLRAQSWNSSRRDWPRLRPRVKTPTLLVRLAVQAQVRRLLHPVRPLARLVHRPHLHLAAVLHQMRILQQQRQLIQRHQGTERPIIPTSRR